MNQVFKNTFIDGETQQPRWNMIGFAILILFIVILLAVKAAKKGYTPDGTPEGNTTNNGGQGQNNQGNNQGGQGNNQGGQWGGSTTNKNVEPAPETPTLRQLAADMFRVTDKTYVIIAGCYGSGDEGERCPIYTKFLALSDAEKKTVAIMYQQSFTKKMYDAVGALFGCKCVTWSEGTLAGQIVKKLEELGLN